MDQTNKKEARHIFNNLEFISSRTRAIARERRIELSPYWRAIL